MLENSCETLIKLLHEKGLVHLDVRIQGDHIIVFSRHEGKEEKRARVSLIREQFYYLGIINDRGNWESPPYTGSIIELSTILLEQYAHALVN